MSESSTKSGFSAVNTEGQIINEDIARQMADKESKLRKKYTKEYTREMPDLTKEELEATIAPTADKAAEDVFKKEAGTEYADAVKEAQVETAYEINAVENSVRGETKKDVEIIEQKPGAEGKDNSDAKKAVENYQDAAQDAKTNSEAKIASVVSGVEIKEAGQDRLNKVKEKVKKRVIEIQETIDILDGKKGGRGEVLTYLKKIAGIEGRNLTKEEEKKYWGRAMYRLKAEKQGHEVVGLFFENNDSPADWEKFQKHLQFSLKSEKNLADEYINKIDKDPAVSKQNKPIELLKKEAMRDSETIQGIFLGLMDKNAQPEDLNESRSDIGEINQTNAEQNKEIKDEKIEAAKKDFENKIKNIDGEIKILENSHGNPYDRRLYIAREAGIDIKQLTPKEEGRQRLIILARRHAEKAGLQKVEEIANDPEVKNYDELQNRLWDNFKSVKSEFSKKCDELDKEPKGSDRRKKLIEEKRDLQAKMQMARDSVADFDNHAAKEREEKDKKRQMRNQKAIKSEPVGKPQEPKAVEPAIVIKSADNQPDSQPKQGGREEMAAAYDQRIANLRLGVNEAEESGNKNEAARLEKFARELEHEKKWRLRNADGKDQGRGENKDIKPQVQSKDAHASKDKMAEPMNYDQEWQSLREQIRQAEKDGKGAEVKRLEQEIYKLEQEQRNEKAAAGEKEREKQRVEQEKNNEAQKQNQLREVEQRIADLRVKITEAEKADNNDKVVELENTLREVQKEQRRLERKEDEKDQEKSQEPAKEVEDKKEEPVSAEAMAGKEKTAEEILREKNIEVYGGAEKLNQIFEDYKRLNELEDRGAHFKEHPLFSEWDALRVKLANVNLEVIGKDRTIDLYKIQNKDEMIRKYFDTKLEESLETFQKDIEKASSNELAIRAATLIKYRNELKNCDWQGKDKYRNTPRKEYLETIKILEQKIDILNGMLPKKEGASPEAALKDMSIDDYKKIEKELGYKGGLPAVIEGEKVKTEMTAEQAARVEGVLKEFNLTAEDAEKVEGFKDLSYGQRLLALENLRQLTLRDVRIGSVKKQKEEAGQAQGFWKKMWTGIKKKYDIAKHEKSISQSLNKEDNLATLTQLTRGMKESKTDVIEKNGKLEFQYISGLENLTPEQAAKVQKFNEVASELSKMPMEWTADDSKKGFFRQMMDKAGLGQSWSPDDPTRGQYNRCQELTAEFQSLKQEVLQVVKQQKDSDLKKDGVEKFDDLETQSHAMAQMLQIENLLRCNRAMNVNPDAEKALMEIKSAPLWRRALNNIATERGIYMAAGFAARSVTVTFLGTAGLVGAGAGMGGYMGYKRGKETLRENDALAQHKDYEETKKKRIEKFQRAKQGKTGPAGEMEKTEKKIEDANVLARNLNNFVEYIRKEDDPKRQMDLARRLRDRVKYVKTALDEGRINFGATDTRVVSLYELTDKLNDAVNCAEMYHPSTRHEADQWSEANQSEVMKKLNEYLDESKIKLSAERRKYLVKKMAVGALYGAGFVTAGMMVREVASHIDPHLFNAQGETDLGVRWISAKGGAGKPFVGGIVGKYLHGEPGSGGGGLSPHGPDAVGHGGGAEKSFFGEFADDPSKNHDMFPWEKPTTYSPEIPIGQGSFAERFLRAVGIHEGSPAKPDLQKIVAEYSEYFRNHPELLKNNNSSSEFLKHLKSDLQNAGLDSDAAKNITTEFNAEMGKMGTGIYPEGEVLPGIDSTGGSGGGEHAAATAGDAGKTAAETLVGAKQDALASAVETASGKMNSVWKMIGHQLDQRGIFKGLTGTPEEIAAKKTYMIDYFKDMVAKDPKRFGLNDIDDLRVGQKVDLSKLFESHPRLGEIIRDTNALPADKLASIFKHDQIIAEFHRLHPEVPIISENVDQIAAGHGDALLKKAVEQAASEQVQPSAQDAIIQPGSPKIPHQPASPYEDMLRNNIEGRIKEVQRLTDETVGERLNKIFDYAFGRQGPETSTYQDIKNEIADHFLKRNLSGETDINDPFAIDSDDARRYGELQQYLRELIKENHAAPRTGETVADFIKRSVSAAIRSDIGKLTESPADPKSELI